MAPCEFSSPARPASSARTSSTSGWGVHPDDSLVALDLLTYAGNRANLEAVDVPFVQADIADLDIVENVLARA